MRSLAWVPVTALLAGLGVACTPLDAWLSRPLTDWQQRLAAPATPPEGVLVIDIDDASLRSLQPVLGPWPYKRDVYALLVEQLREAGAQAVAIDLLLADAQVGDAALARAIARPGAPVVLAAAGLLAGPDSPPLAAAAKAAPAPAAWHRPAQAWPGLSLPAETLWPQPGQPPRLGVVTTPLDADGRLRSQPLWHAARGQHWPMLPLAVWQALHGDAAPPADWPQDDAARVVVAFNGPDTAVPVLPFAEVARAALGLAPTATLVQAARGRVVFIGSSAQLAANVMTVNGQASGTAVLAQTYAALRDGRLLRPGAAWAGALLLALALAPALWLWRRGRACLRHDSLAAAMALLAVLATGGVLLMGWQMPLPWAAPGATLATGLLLSLVLHQRWLAATHQRLAQERAVAAAANLAKSEFLANVSHEIRTPMNALLGVAELLAETPLNAEQRRHVQVFQESGQSLHTLINDLLDLSKIEAGRFELDESPFSLHAMLAGLVALQRPRAAQKGLQFVFERADDVPDGVRGDRQRLAQALNNLLANAIKFTAQGEVRLSVASEGDGRTAALRFSVADTGIGIAPSKLQSVFEPFAQADASVTRHYGGTGLGLAITRSVVQLMGGRLAVQSQPAQGSVFTVTLALPAAVPPGQAALAAQVPGGPAPHGAPTVLLAEDNEVNVYVFQAMLAPHCQRIDVATNGPTALAMALRERYDLVFMDVQMPGMDGLSVTREIRRAEREGGLAGGRERLPVVALTANAYETDRQRSAEAGCDLHLAKPFTRAQLLEAMLRFVPAHAAALRQSLAELPAAPAVPTQPASPTAVASPPHRPLPPEQVALDTAKALARLGGDAVLLARVLDHAQVFIERWPQAFDGALLQGPPALARSLAHDLRSIAASIGADALSAQAAELEAAIIDSPSAQPPARLVAQLRTAIAPVIVALSRR